MEWWLHARRLAHTLMIVLMALTLVLPQPAHALAGPLQADEVNAFLDTYIAAQLQDQQIAGSVVAVVQHGEVLAARGFGDADVEHNIPVDPERTRFRIGSITKVFIGTAVMQLVELGKLDLHADINGYLTDIQIPSAFGQPVTLAHLLTHTAGFEELNRGLMTLDPAATTSLRVFLRDNMPARIYPPGTISSYSNYGLALAGQIVENVAGEPLDQYLERHVFAPLEMRDTTYRQSPPQPLSATESRGYSWDGTHVRPVPYEYVNAAPAGAISATAADMAHFMIAHLGDGQSGQRQILRDATRQEMHRMQFANDARLPNG